MAVPPKFASHRLLFGNPSTPSSTIPPARHTLEFYLDYCCPFSAKMVKTLTSSILPLIKSNPAYADNLEVIFRQHVQPWHPQSTTMHEAAVAVNQVDPDKFWTFSELLFARAGEFYDVQTATEGRNAIYKRLAKVAAEAGVDEEKVLERLVVPTEPVGGESNMGNKTTADLKVLIKMGRATGVHVTPSVVFDGVFRGEISSSWTAEQWKEWFEKNVV